VLPSKRQATAVLTHAANLDDDSEECGFISIDFDLFRHTHRFWIPCSFRVWMVENRPASKCRSLTMCSGGLSNAYFLVFCICFCLTSRHNRADNVLSVLNGEPNGESAGKKSKKKVKAGDDKKSNMEADNDSLFVDDIEVGLQN
jgi:hypothetical protein